MDLHTPFAEFSNRCVNERGKLEENAFSCNGASVWSNSDSAANCEAIMQLKWATLRPNHDSADLMRKNKEYVGAKLRLLGLGTTPC